MYDLHGVTPDADPSASFSFDENGSDNINLNFTHPSHTARADETLSGVLLGVFLDFMEGDFQMLRTFLREYIVFLSLLFHGKRSLSIPSLGCFFAQASLVSLCGQDEAANCTACSCVSHAKRYSSDAIRPDHYSAKSFHPRSIALLVASLALAVQGSLRLIFMIFNRSLK